MLETAPSLSIYTKNNDTIELEDTQNEIQRQSSTSDFSFVKPEDNMNNNMDFITEEEEPKEEADLSDQLQPPSPPMYLATGLGLGLGLQIGFREGSDKEDGEDHFRQLLQEYPNHPLVLKYYAQFLEKKGELEGAEEYYFRAAKADPSDGEVVSKYALLVWELHRDQERASTYFELAAQAAPKDSTVLAAYAKFLWEIDDDNALHVAQYQKPADLHSTEANINSAVGIGLSEEENQYRRMAEENSSNPLHLKNYAQYLFESKGDLEGAEELYRRAISANPKDGDTLLQYATLVWELYHDKKTTLNYIEQAIQAAPEDSNILAAYARFLWTIDDENA